MDHRRPDRCIEKVASGFQLTEGPLMASYSRPTRKLSYVANSDDKNKVWMRYDVAADGAVSNGKVFADVTAEKEDDSGRRFGVGDASIAIS